MSHTRLLTQVLRAVASAGVLAASLVGTASPGAGPKDSAALLPLRTAHAAPGTWTQTEWTTPNAALGVAPSGTNQYFRPSSVSSFGQLVGTFGVCAGAGVWCQGPGDSAGGQTLRLAGNHKSDGANPYSSDLNGDGISELLFSNAFDGSTRVFNGGWIYWGQGTPGSPTWGASQRTDLPTAGTISVTSADLNGDGWPEVLFANSPDVNGPSHTFIYWGLAGGPHGVQYSTAAHTDLPTYQSVTVAAADLNADGRPELVVLNEVGPVSYIYWGQAGGPYGVQYSDAARTDLPSSAPVGVAIADLNADGLPEVVFSGYSSSSYIYWGQAGGPYGVTYTVSARTNLPTTGGLGVAVVDLNSDNQPEVILPGSFYGAGDSYIYWGQAGGPHGVTYTVSARTNLPSVGAQSVSVADLNGDGQRDVVVQNYHGGFTRVFWGPLPGSGTATISWTLPINFGFRGLNLSDLNADGRIDLVISHLATDWSWVGGTSGRVYFHNGNNTAPYNATPSFDLPVQSASSAYASFGPGRGSSADWFGQPRPVYGTAFPNYGVLESMVMDSGQNGTVWHTVSATTQISAGTGITLFVAASDNLAALSSPTWTPVGAMGNGSWTQGMSGVSGRYARYRVILWRDRTTEASPALQDITFNYETLAQPFNKTAPANGATGQPTNPTLSWGASAGADHYRYCNSTTSGCTPATSVGTNTSVALSGLTPGATYYWQVRACADAGCTVFTDADGSGGHWSFSTQGGISFVDTSGPTGTRKEVTPTVVRMGALVSYTIVLSNSGSAAVTTQVTDTLAVSATLVSATPGYAQSGQTLVWSGVNVPAGGTAVLTITVRAGSGPLPGGYTLNNSVTIGAVDGEIVRYAPFVEVGPWRAYAPIVVRPPDMWYAYVPIAVRP